MVTVTREQLAAYLDDALGETETAQVEQALRQSEALRRLLRALMEEIDRGEHSVGAIWRRLHLTCPSREQLGSFLLGVLESAHQDYIDFHLDVIGCSFCQANLADLQNQQKEPAAQVHKRRRKFLESSVGLLPGGRRKGR